ncbi:hypothetical protein C8R47DRAFT_988786, partial [Mycena vitilis]
ISSSTRNTRIERLWVEVGTQFARRWRAFFTRLGRLHGLDRKNPSHLWLLHHLFLEEINDDCLEFQEEWNLHPMGGPTTNDQSPADLRLLGQLTEGVYREDPLAGIHPDAINRYYGIAGRHLHRSRTQTGAGITSEDEEDEVEEDDVHEPSVEEQIENQVQADLAQNIRHEPVKVANHGSPFDEVELEIHFLSLLLELVSEPDVVPEDFGILPEEWEDDDYPEVEVIRPGTKGKELAVILPRDEWFAKAVRWVQGLDLMTRVLHELEEDNSGSDSASYGSDEDSD